MNSTLHQSSETNKLQLTNTKITLQLLLSQYTIILFPLPIFLDTKGKSFNALSVSKTIFNDFEF